MSTILFRSPNWLGDAVMATVVPPALRRRFERVAVLCPAGLQDVWRATPEVDEVVPFGSGGEVDAYRSAGYDRVLLGPLSFGSAWRAWRGRTRFRHGFGGSGRDWLLASRLPVAEYRRDRHQVKNYRVLAGLVGEPSDGDAPEVRPTDGWRVEAEALWPGDGRWRVALQPGAQYGPAKRWPADRFGEVARRLLDVGASVAVVGGPADREVADDVLGHERGILDFVGRTSVGSLAAVLERADVLITNDTGPMHLAAAVGTPTVALFGSTNPTWTRPYGDGHRVLSHPMDCQPCYQRTCSIGYQCLTGIDLESVVNGALAGKGAE